MVTSSQRSLLAAFSRFTIKAPGHEIGAHGDGADRLGESCRTVKVLFIAVDECLAVISFVGLLAKGCFKGAIPPVVDRLNVDVIVDFVDVIHEEHVGGEDAGDFVAVVRAEGAGRLATLDGVDAVPCLFHEPVA